LSYLTHRPSIRSGDLLAWTHRGLHSYYDLEVQLVRVFTRSEYSHVGLAWDIGRRVLVLEAVRPLIRIYPLSLLLPSYWLERAWDWTEGDVEFALSKVGQRYSKWEAVKSFFGHVTPGLDARWQCAEYAAAVLAREGLRAEPTPSDLVRAAQESGARLTLLT
jgi:hypothetical protein